MARDVPPRVSAHTPSTISVVLGGVEYEILPLPVKPERVWKQTVDAQLDTIFDLIEGMPDQQIATTSDLMPILRTLKHQVLYATDTILDLVCAYAPNVAADRDRIEEEAYTPEIIDLFLQIVPVAFPLERLTPALRGLASLRTSQSLPVRNGASANAS